MIDLRPWANLGMALLSLLGLVYTLGVKFTALETKVDTMWQVTVLDALKRQVRVGNVQFESDPALTPKGITLLSNETRSLLEGICPGRNLAETVVAIARSFPPEKLWRLTHEAQCLPSEVLAALALYCQTHHKK